MPYGSRKRPPEELAPHSTGLAALPMDMARIFAGLLSYTLNSRKEVAEKFNKRPDDAPQNRHTC